jgi:hypothetical protein
MTNDLEALTADELYFLRLDVLAVLRAQLLAKKNVLEKRLQQLQPPGDHEITQSESRRPDRVSRSCLIDLKVYQYGWTRWDKSGGRPGVRNHATIERAALAERIIAEAEGKPGRKLGREMLEELAIIGCQSVRLDCPS